MILHTIVGKVRGWQRYHEVLRELSSLDDHMLSDISLSRCDFERIALEAAKAVEAEHAGHGRRAPKAVPAHA